MAKPRQPFRKLATHGNAQGNESQSRQNPTLSEPVNPARMEQTSAISPWSGLAAPVDWGSLAGPTLFDLRSSVGPRTPSEDQRRQGAEWGIWPSRGSPSGNLAPTATRQETAHQPKQNPTRSEPVDPARIEQTYAISPRSGLAAPGVCGSLAGPVLFDLRSSPAREPQRRISAALKRSGGYGQAAAALPETQQARQRAGFTDRVSRSPAKPGYPFNAPANNVS